MSVSFSGPFPASALEWQRAHVRSANTASALFNRVPRAKQSMIYLLYKWLENQFAIDSRGLQGPLRGRAPPGVTDGFKKKDRLAEDCHRRFTKCFLN